MKKMQRENISSQGVKGDENKQDGKRRRCDERLYPLHEFSRFLRSSCTCFRFM